MSFRVIYEEKAIDQAAGFLADDPAGLGAVLDAVDRLPGDARPAESFPYGSPDPSWGAARISPKPAMS